MADNSHCNSSSVLCQRCLRTADFTSNGDAHNGKSMGRHIARGTPPSFLFLHSTHRAIVSARNIIIRIQNVIRYVMCKPVLSCVMLTVRAVHSCAPGAMNGPVARLKK